MIVRDIRLAEDTKREVKAQNWTSTRLLLSEDNLGFSFHETIVKPDTETRIWYKNHLEAVYCIEGSGEIEEENGTRHKIFPGIIYALDKHDKHVLRAFTQMRMICVFNPALVGEEVHDENGIYPLLEYTRGTT
ncbi:MAG: ectoine synthase [Nitrosarchaeum sp.]|nr:ectoine synthase [Nitrosarchaeum sp.]MCA9820059.1 ectoine synthase [Nitrosarchaeum sp.]